jgi:hypothetical protein
MNVLDAFRKHTSAALTVNENYDRGDVLSFMFRGDQS